MSYLLIAITSALLITLILLFLPQILMARSTTDREKLSPFECGFEPRRTARLPFSMRFFLLAVIFLVFDVEIVLLLPLPAIISSASIFPLILGALPFLIILIIGLLHEWHEGSLNWTW